MRHILDIGNDRARRSHAGGVFIVGDAVDFFGIAPFGEGDAEIGRVGHVANRIDGGVHLQGAENSLADKLFPGLART